MALLGVVIAGAVAELMVLLGRATRLSEHEHEMHRHDVHPEL